jgi:VanZ family protein
MSDSAAGEGAGAVPVAPAARRPVLVLGTLAVAYAALIYWLSAQANPFPFVPGAILARDRLLHAAGYALLGALLAATLLAARVRRARAFVLAALLASVYGASDEWHQAHVPGRQADPIDWAADSAGALGGALLAASLRRRGARASIRA